MAIFKNDLFDINIAIFKKDLIDIDINIFLNDLIDINIFKKYQYIDNRYGLLVYRKPLVSPPCPGVRILLF